MQLHHCEGTRIYIVTPEGPGYVDADALAVPAGFCPPLSTVPVSLKTVVLVVAGPRVYTQTAGLLSKVQDWVRQALGPGDVAVLVWPTAADIIPPIEVPRTVASPATATPAPAVTAVPCQLFLRDCKLQMEATATAIASQPTPAAQQSREQAIATYLDKRASELAGVRLDAAPGTSDLLPALSRASTILAHGAGSRYLLIAAPFQAPDVDALNRLNLRGSLFRLLAPDCARPVLCQEWRSAWETWASGAQVDFDVLDTSVRLTDEVR